MEPSVKVSIIIPCFNRVDRTAECWKALEQTVPETISAEVIFIDNGSSDGTRKFLDSLGKKFPTVVIRNPENIGFAKANNQAAAQARGEILLFLNNDTVPLAGWLEPMLDLLANEANAGIVGSKLIYPDGRVQHAGIVVRERVAGKAQLVCDHIHRLSQHTAPWVNQPREFQAVTGACMALPRETFERVGGFDEAFRNGYEDLDLCFRARAAGLRVSYCPRSVVVHYESSSQGRFLSDEANTKLFSERWGARISSDENEAYAAAGRPNLQAMQAELEAARVHFEKVVAPHPDAAEKSGVIRRTIQRWLGLTKAQRQFAADIRAIRHSLLHLRRATESMALLLDHRDLSGTSETPGRADNFLQ